MAVVLPSAEFLAWSPERIKAFQMDDSLVGTTRAIDDAPYMIQFRNSELNDQPGQRFDDIYFGERASYVCDKDGSIRTVLKFTVERTDSNAVFLAQMFNRPIMAEFKPVQMDAFEEKQSA